MIKTILMRHLILCRSVRVGVSVQSRDGKVEYEIQETTATHTPHPR